MNITSRIICPDFEKHFPRLSLSALGVLGQMINVPELDYCTFNKLCQSNPADNPDEIKEAVNELHKEGFIIFVDENILAVNKHIITQMKERSLRGELNVNI